MNNAARLVFGLDASRALTNAPTGTEYYSRALIDSLLRLDSRFSFRLYTRARLPPNFLPATDNYEIRAMPFPRLWTHLRLAFEMLVRAPDALFVPAHVLPPFHPRNSIVTVHDLGYRYFPETHRTFQRAYLDWSTRWNVNAARIVVADSSATRDDIVKFYGVPVGKIRVVYPGYNADLFQPTRDADDIARVRQKYALGDKYFASVGTLHPRKNYARLVEASAQLPFEYSLVIIGKKGWLYDSILARVRELNMEARVTFLDYAPLQDLPALYAGAQCAVFPSLYEGFGFPALEAQACETALVCANTSSLPEVAGDAAEFFDPLNVDAMARAMRNVLENATRRAELIARGRENVKRFSWERAAREILEIVSAF
ncbi:MAG: glycosyltransferase family 4 protein [Chloroflexi bacterium]|nr:glycosyltransferase family 4 protein [Chloroflexota bacterium]